MKYPNTAPTSQPIKGLRRPPAVNPARRARTFLRREQAAGRLPIKGRITRKIAAQFLVAMDRAGE